MNVTEITATLREVLPVLTDDARALRHQQSLNKALWFTRDDLRTAADALEPTSPLATRYRMASDDISHALNLLYPGYPEHFKNEKGFAQGMQKDITEALGHLKTTV